MSHSAVQHWRLQFLDLGVEIRVERLGLRV